MRRQLYRRYETWECFKAGMWEQSRFDRETEDAMLSRAREFTGDHRVYGDAMLRVIREWPITCEHHLTDQSINRRAFIGHAAVCLALGIPERITRAAWAHLSISQQDAANRRADEAISMWERDQRKREAEIVERTQIALEF